MSANDSPLVQPLTATVGFARKVGLPNYSNAEVSLYFPVELPRSEDFDGDVEAYFKSVDDRLRSGFTTVKAHIFEQLGIEFEDKGGVLIEKLAQAFPGAVEAQATAAPQRASRPASPPAAGGPEECSQCGGTEFYDNRARKASGEYKPKAPDFKCKGCSKGVWNK